MEIKADKVWTYDGSFYVSTGLGHWMPRYLIKHYFWCACEGVSAREWYLNWWTE